MNMVKLSAVGILIFLLPVLMPACATAPRATVTVLAKPGDTVEFYRGVRIP